MYTDQNMNATPTFNTQTSSMQQFPMSGYQMTPGVMAIQRARAAMSGPGGTSRGVPMYNTGTQIPGMPKPGPSTRGIPGRPAAAPLMAPGRPGLTR